MTTFPRPGLSTRAASNGGDGRLADPILEALDGFVVAFFDFRANGVEIARMRLRPARHRERRRGSRSSGRCALQKNAAVGRREGCLRICFLVLAHFYGEILCMLISAVA